MISCLKVAFCKLKSRQPTRDTGVLQPSLCENDLEMAVNYSFIAKM